MNNEIARAVDLLKKGGLVAFPTETVYGLGADASNERAIQRIFEIKKRPAEHPLIVHLAKASDMTDWAAAVPPLAYTFANACWPGPLTLILPKKKEVSPLITGGQDTIGLRVPAHPVAQALLTAFGGGIVAPSANVFTHVSPTTAQDVVDEFGDQIPMILDGGPCSVGLESTIVDLTKQIPVILRPGMITKAMLETISGIAIATLHNETSRIRTPGMHHLHYAPTTHTLLCPQRLLAGQVEMATANHHIALLVYSNVPLPSSPWAHVVHMPQEVNAYAHLLYHTLRVLDHEKWAKIVVEEVPDQAEWEAIRDRLLKATARNKDELT